MVQQDSNKGSNGTQPPLCRHANNLLHEKSPYLLQHAHNPVDWYPWGDDAFQRAIREDKPVFLSIGYATAYVCSSHACSAPTTDPEKLPELLGGALQDSNQAQ
jgi:uncharacterized protein YyaL (SSP411 family)